MQKGGKKQTVVYKSHCDMICKEDIKITINKNCLGSYLMASVQYVLAFQGHHHVLKIIKIYTLIKVMKNTWSFSELYTMKQTN